MPKHLTTEKREQAAELAQLMIPVPDIAARFGVSEATIRRLLKARGVRVPKIPRPPMLNDGQARVARLSYLSGSTIHELAADYGISVTAMWNVLRRHGCVFRPRGRKPAMDPEQVDQAQRLRRTGHTLQQIADAIGGVDHSAVWRALKRTMP